MTPSKPADSIGYILSTLRYNAIGSREIEDFALAGGPFFEVSRELAMQSGNITRLDERTLMIGPYRMLIVEDNAWERVLLCLLDTGWWSRIKAWGYQHAYLLRLTKSRVILTFAIWGLARNVEAAVPEWDDKAAETTSEVEEPRYWSERMTHGSTG